ncbi:MAG: hypothetical protein QW051_02010 [Candidatus Aenigmatarchaeota archaeon]
MSMVKKEKIVYLCFSEKNSNLRFKAMSLAKERGFTPIYPNIVVDLTKTLGAAKEMEGSSKEDEKFSQIKKASEIWVLGEVEGEMKDDISLGKRLGKKIRYFKVYKQGVNLNLIEVK